MPASLGQPVRPGGLFMMNEFTREVKTNFSSPPIYPAARK
jgi:hypothetical protein